MQARLLDVYCGALKRVDFSGTPSQSFPSLERRGRGGERRAWTYPETRLARVGELANGREQAGGDSGSSWLFSSGRCGTTGDAGRRAGAKGVGGGGARREKQDQCHGPGIALLWFGLTYK